MIRTQEEADALLAKIKEETARGKCKFCALNERINVLTKLGGFCSEACSNRASGKAKEFGSN